MHKAHFVFLVSLIFFSSFSASSARMGHPKNIEASQNQPKQKISNDELQFEYVSEDGTYWLECAHWQRDDSLPDWDVICGKGTDYVREFHVVFWLRTHTRERQPQTYIENVYYVTDRNSKPIRFTSHSNWIELSKATEVTYLKFYQGVENDYASLTVTYRPHLKSASSKKAL